MYPDLSFFFTRSSVKFLGIGEFRKNVETEILYIPDANHLNFGRRWRLLNSLKLREGITHEGDSLERAGASHAQDVARDIV